MTEKCKINNLYSSFKLIGTVVMSKDKDKYCKQETSKKGYTYKKMQFGIKTSDTNTVFIELMGGYFNNGTSVIKTKDKDNNKLEIAWKDRTRQDIVDSVSRKLKVELVKDEIHEFLAEYDFIEYIQQNLKSDMRIVVEGNMRIERYKDKQGKPQVITKFIPSRIRLPYDKETDSATGIVHFVYGSDCYDDGALETDNKIYINGYVTSYNKEFGGTFFVPKTFIINGDKRHLNPELFGSRTGYYKQILQAKEGEYKEIKWEVTIVRGAEEVEISDDDLNEDQLEQIKFGVATREEIIKDMRNGMIQDRVDEIRLIRPKNAFENKPTNVTGYIDNDFIINEHSEEKMSDVVGESNSSSNPSPEEDAVLGLFG